MNPENDRFRNLLGVTAWHKAGYTGKRGLTFTGESETTPHLHGGLTMEAHLEIAPDRTIVCPTPNKSYAINRDDVPVVFAKAKELGADVMYQSYTGDKDLWDGPECPEDFFIASAAGNFGASDYTERLEAEQVYGVAAVTLMADGSVLPAYYSSDNPYNDFAAPANLWLFHHTETGTSFAAPVLAGMVALVNDMAIEKTGRPLKAKAMYRFLKDCCMDIAEKGKDDDTGWGMPVLPPPETVDIWRYQDEVVTAEEVLELARGEIGVVENPANSSNVKYNTDYYGRVINDPAYHWCATFLWWLFKKKGAPGLYYGGGKTASCSTLYGYHKARGQAVTEYRPGDIIFFDFSGNGKSTEHVGICESVDGEYITTIDGNTGTTNEANGGAVMRRRRLLKYVSAAYRPAYKEEEEMTLEQFKEFYDEVNPLYTSLTQIPDYWRAEAADLIMAGVIKGDLENPIAIRQDALQSVIISKRLIEGGE